MASGDLNAAPGSGAWARQPVVWLGAAILAASIIGCVAMVVLAWRYPDAPVPTGDATAMKVPVQRSTATPAPASESPK